MICHKCGAILPDNSIRCNHCGIRVSMVCPECKTVVSFGERFCSHCGFELLKICHNCNSANVYSSKECRKCHTPLISINENGHSFSNKQDKQFNPAPKLDTQYSDVKIDGKTDLNLTYKDVDIETSPDSNILSEFSSTETHKNEDLDFDNLIENINKNESNKKTEIIEDDVSISNSTKEQDIAKIEYKKDDDNNVIDDVVKYQIDSKTIENDSTHKNVNHTNDFFADNEFIEYIPNENNQEVEKIQDYPFAKGEEEYFDNMKKNETGQISELYFYDASKENTSNITNLETDKTPDVQFAEDTEEYNVSDITSVETIKVNDINVYEEANGYPSDIVDFQREATQDIPFDSTFEEHTLNQQNKMVEPSQDASSNEIIQEYTESPEGPEVDSGIIDSITISEQENIQKAVNQEVQQNDYISEEKNIENREPNLEEAKVASEKETDKTSGDVKFEQAVSSQPENKKIDDKENQKPKKRSIIPSKYNKEILNKPAVVEVLTKIRKSIKKHVIAINGPEGCGKSAVIRQVKEILSMERYMTLYGSCSPLSQITSYGFFQDAFLRLLGFPPYRNNLDAFMRDFNRSQFKKAFNFLKPKELSLFLNFLYPTESDGFENILENKQLMFTVIEKIIKAFLTNTNMVIIIDNFDLLDGASYDFINYILGKNFFNTRLKLLVAYQDDKPIQSFFDKVKYDIFENITLNKFTDEELKNILKITIGLDVKDLDPNTYLDDVIARADGNAIRLEQDVAFLFDINNIYIAGNKILIHPENKPEQPLMSVEELIKFRVNFLPAPVKNVLFMAAILGYRFATDVICQAATSELKDTIDIINLLRNELFIVNVDDFTCEFKNLAIWKLIYKEAQNDLLFKENSERLYEVLKSRVLSSNIQKLISCSAALDKKEEFSIWQNTTELTAKLGDTNLFVIAQKQCLKILEEIDMPNADNVRVIIYEQIGKLLSKKSPFEAISYLSNVLDARIKKKNTNKIVDVSGYFINSCYLTGNYFGVVEAVDAVVKHFQDLGVDLGAQIALIKTRKLNALVNIGNTEQLINLIKENLLIKINQELTSKQLDISYKNLLMDIWFDANIILAKAYALQGNIEVFATTAYIRDVIKNNNIQNAVLEAKVTLIEALAHTLVGETSISNEILTSIKNDKNLKIVDKKLLCEWNMIKIINRIYEHDINGIKTDLFELAEFANNINEHATKHIIKLILGYVLKEEGDTTKAMSIYNDEITYFSKEKMAIGAMLAWALIAKASIDTGSLDMALTTATKAYDVSQSPKINNAFFGIYFQKLIAEIYLLKGDFLSVKMYLEKALSIAEKENIKFMLAYIYIDYGKYMEEYMKSKEAYEKENVIKTIEYYEKASNIAREIGNKWVKEKALKARTSFKTFCQLSAINLS